eukprot:jgi/Antlo1/251/1320
MSVESRARIDIIICAVNMMETIACTEKTESQCSRTMDVAPFRTVDVKGMYLIPQYMYTYSDRPAPRKQRNMLIALRLAAANIKKKAIDATKLA